MEDKVFSFIRELNKLSKKYKIYLYSDKFILINGKKEDMKYIYDPLTLEVKLKKEKR